MSVVRRATYLSLLALAITLTLIPSVHAGELWGYVDPQGNDVIKPQFARAADFMHGFATTWGYSTDGSPDLFNMLFIDKTGHRYETGTPTGVKYKTKSDAYEEYDFEGHHIVQDTFKILSVRGQMMFVRRSHDLGVADLNGSLKILPRWQRTYIEKHWLPEPGSPPLPPGWRPKGENPITGNQWCKVGDQAYEFTGITKSDMPGFEPVDMPPDFQLRFDYFDGFHEGLAAALTRDRHWVYINAAGKVAIDLPKDCSNAQSFHEGLAAVSVGGVPWPPASYLAPNNAWSGAKFGFIDKTGQFVIPPQFRCPHLWGANPRLRSQFVNGLALATAYKNGCISFGYINRNGKFVVPPIYRAVAEFSDGLANVNAQAVEFDQKKWAEAEHKVGVDGFSRMDLFAPFLRQYDLVGMAKAKVEALIGVALTEPGSAHSGFYSLDGTDSRLIGCRVHYDDDDRVDGYQLLLEHGPSISINTNVKPADEHDLEQFCNEHRPGTPMPYNE